MHRMDCYSQKKKKKVKGQAQKFIGHVSLHPEVGYNLVDGCPPSFPPISFSSFSIQKNPNLFILRNTQKHQKLQVTHNPTRPF